MRSPYNFHITSSYRAMSGTKFQYDNKFTSQVIGWQVTDPDDSNDIPIPVSQQLPTSGSTTIKLC